MKDPTEATDFRSDDPRCAAVLREDAEALATLRRAREEYGRTRKAVSAMQRSCAHRWDDPVGYDQHDARSDVSGLSPTRFIRRCRRCGLREASSRVRVTGYAPEW